VIWGVDVGIRSFALWGIGSSLNVGYFFETDKKGRYQEIAFMRDRLKDFVKPSSLIFIEEPPRAGSLNIRTALQLNQTVGALMAAHEGMSYLVPVSSWKKAVVGNGSADKKLVSSWLADKYPRWHARCQDNQNIMDAVCIALYGQKVVDASDSLATLQTQ
jgi:Holliday junction resolvasome RuvABC endonuclease subunit